MVSIKKNILAFAGTLVFALLGHAQSFSWAIQFAGNGYDGGRAIAVDASGNIYTTGFFSDSIDFDPGPGLAILASTNGSRDVFVAKVDPSGNLVWANRIGGNSVDNGYGIAVDSQNADVYLTGSFGGTVDFDPGTGVSNLSSLGNEDIYVAKWDAAGNFVWAKQIGGHSNGSPTHITLDGAGNTYVTGYFEGTADFDPGLGVDTLSSHTASDVFVVKLDGSGNLIWARNMGGSNYCYGLGITVDVAGNVYTAGHFQGAADFDPGIGNVTLQSNGYADIFFSKFDADGNFRWVKQAGDSQMDVASCISSDPNGFLYLTGMFANDVDFNPGPGTSILSTISNNDIFVAKYDTAGNFYWARQMGGPDEDYGSSLQVDGQGNVYTTGHFRYTSDFDPGPGTETLVAIGPPDVFVSKLDAMGNHVWAAQVSGTDDHRATGLVVDPFGYICVTGEFVDTTDFDPSAASYSLAGVAHNDIYVLKLNQTSTGLPEIVKDHNIFFIHPNPASQNLNVIVTKPSTLSIANLLGEELINCRVNSSAEIDISFLPSGIYLVKALDNGQILKWIKP